MTKEGWALRFLLRMVLSLYEQTTGGATSAIRQEVDDLSILLSGGMTMKEFVEIHPEFDMETND